MFTRDKFDLDDLNVLLVDLGSKLNLCQSST